MSAEMMSLRIPGSTSNLGPGFDSLGLAVNRYLDLDVHDADSWYFEPKSANLQGIPSNEDNLIYQAAAIVATEAGRTLPPCHVRLTSDIPLARGLGSSAAAIVAAVELADHLLDLNLTKQEKFQFGARFEGHCDNVGASQFGGLVVVSGGGDEKSECVPLPAPNVDMVVMVPSYELKTEKARSVLPNTIPFKEAVKGSSVTNVMLAAILQNDWEKAGVLMEEDVFHQPYRLPLVPDLTEVITYAKKIGAYGAALSGAGPTLICFTPQGEGEKISYNLKNAFPHYESDVVFAEANGAQMKTPSIETL